MKKLTFLLFITTIIACNKNENKEETKNNSVVWAENAYSKTIVERDTMWDEKDWNDTYKYDKEKIFKTVVGAVNAGKLKAYSFYPVGELSISDFNKRLVYWDSTYVIEDVKNPGTFISAPKKITISGDDIVEMRMDEKMEFDTLTNTLNKKISYIRFIGKKYTPETHEAVGLTVLFDVKFGNDSSVETKEKK